MEFTLVNGIKLYVPHSKEELIEEAFRQKKILSAINAEQILESNLKQTVFSSNHLGYPDGIGAVMVLKKQGLKAVQKIPEVELWLEIIQKFHGKKSFYLVGDKEEVMQETVTKLKKAYPQISILGYRTSYLNSGYEKSFLAQDILNKKPDIVFFALDSPKQEELLEELCEMHPALYMGLRGSFDVYTGRVQRAPRWWIANNLEWAYNFIQQPRGINRLLGLVKFFLLLQLGKFQTNNSNQKS